MFDGTDTADSPHLRNQSPLLARREPSSESIYGFNQIHAPLPNEQIFVAIDHLSTNDFQSYDLVFLTLASCLSASCLFPIHPIDKSFLLQLAHDAVVDQVIYCDFTSRCLF